MYTWSYKGPVVRFNYLGKDEWTRCAVIVNEWTAYTVAPSEAKAKANLTFRFKKENGYSPSAKIVLPGEVRLEVVS